jgi:hypothetical protein
VPAHTIQPPTRWHQPQAQALCVRGMPRAAGGTPLGSIAATGPHAQTHDPRRLCGSAALAPTIAAGWPAAQRSGQHPRQQQLQLGKQQGLVQPLGLSHEDGSRCSSRHSNGLLGQVQSAHHCVRAWRWLFWPQAAVGPAKRARAVLPHSLRIVSLQFGGSCRVPRVQRQLPQAAL